MQHASAPGHPSPPLSPSLDQQQCPVRCFPLAPEDRLGSFLTGTLQLMSILGTGAYGVVYSANDTKTGVRYAVKCLSKFNANGTPLDRRQVAFQMREIRLHYLASAHPNVVSMLKIIDKPDCIYVILEYCPEGDLFFNITERGQYVAQDGLAKKVFLQILDAVEHCHSLGIFHRDLKPENILVSNNGGTVKLADFGLATSSDRSEDYGCGSTFYMSPECLDHASGRPYYYCAPNDIWSLGVILVNLTCGRNPWKQACFDDYTYRAYSKNQEFLKTILPVTDELNDILARVFTPSPEHRMTISELRASIVSCQRFTESVGPSSLPASLASLDGLAQYVHAQDCVSGGDYDALDAPFPSTSAGSMSDDESGLSDDGSSLESLEDLDEHDFPDMMGPKTPPPQPMQQEPAVYVPEDARMPFLPDMWSFFTIGTGSPVVPIPTEPSCKFPHGLDPPKPAPPGLYHPVPFYQHDLSHLWQGCH